MSILRLLASPEAGRLLWALALGFTAGAGVARRISRRGNHR